jgi:hypothetical protein
MEKNFAPNKRNTRFSDSKLKKGIEIQNNKILPNLDKRYVHRFHKENEWDQEYYIIYNSYILEDKDSES